MSTRDHLLGTAGILLAFAVSVLGWRLTKRYGAAIQYTGIGRGAPIGNSVLAFLGVALLILGLVIAMVVSMVTFF